MHLVAITLLRPGTAARRGVTVMRAKSSPPAEASWLPSGLLELVIDLDATDLSIGPELDSEEPGSGTDQFALEKDRGPVAVVARTTGIELWLGGEVGERDTIGGNGEPEVNRSLREEGVKFERADRGIDLVGD